MKRFDLRFQSIKWNEVDGKTVSEIQLFKLGAFEHWSGTQFTVDDSFMDSMITNFQASQALSKDHKIIPIDYNHASLEDGEISKAAGWVTTLTKKPDGLYATVEWTPAGAEYIKNQEFKYISPEFGIEPKDEYGDNAEGPVLFAGAMTNRPFLKGMQPLSLKAKKEEQMKKLLKLFDLKDESTEEELIAAANVSVQANADARKALELKEGASLVDAIKVVLAERDSHKQKSIELGKELTKLSESKADADAKSKVEKLLTEGKLVPAQRDEMILFAKENPERFDKIASSLPKVVKFETTEGAGSEEDPTETLHEATLKIAEEKGVSYVKAYEMAKKANPKLVEKHAKASAKRN